MTSQQNIKILPKFNTLPYIVLSVFLFFVSNIIIAQNNKFTVVLDAGHGGKDPGTVGLQTFKGKYEKDIALAVVKKLGKYLDKQSDIKTVYTRKKNEFIEIHKRGKIANDSDGDLFISIHCNSAVTNAYGATTYVLGMATTNKNLELSKRENDVILLEDDREKNYKYNPNSNEFLISVTLMQEIYLERSIEFASIVQSKFKTVAKRKDRGVRQGNFVVLYDSSRPSVLIEIGFLTNKVEEKYLHSSKGQDKIAESIYEAIKTYKLRLEKNRVKTTVPKKKNVAPTKKTSKSSQTVKKKQKTKTNYSSKFYKIQIATSSKKIEAKSFNFKGLKGMERVKVGNLYKYFYGVANNVSDARKLRLQAVKKGYKDAFIAKFNFDQSTSDVYKLNYINPRKGTKKIAVKKVANKSITNKVTYKIQITSSQKKVDLQSFNFKGLRNVERVKIGRYYKYYYGKTTSYETIQKSLKIAKKKYADCYLVAIKNGKRISLHDALKNK